MKKVIVCPNCGSIQLGELATLKQIATVVGGASSAMCNRPTGRAVSPSALLLVLLVGGTVGLVAGFYFGKLRHSNNVDAHMPNTKCVQCGKSINVT